MNFIETPIKGLLVIEPKIWPDARGYFFESYNQRLFKEAGINVDFVQDNQSLSQKGVLRGLHAQAPPFAQGKLVRVIKGKVLDVVVDVRKGSPTYGQHYSVELSGQNQRIFWVPPGFLHGFATLEDETIFTYKVSGFYNKASEVGVRWDDQSFSIDWALERGDILVSEKDSQLPDFNDFVSPF